jgi:pyrroloquinoline quinone (PQQ) biosynthesis protein C
MNRAEWRRELGEIVRAAMLSPEIERYFKVKITRAGAQVLTTQLGLFIRHRRDCWAHVSANCPHLSVKQKILQHEYGELIKDNYTEHGHLDLIVRQGKALGLTVEETLNVKPLPSTMATLYAWAWMTREKSWLEGLVSLSVTEWANDDRLHQDIGGGLSSRMAQRWMEDLGFTWEQMPNFRVHSQADEEHSDMFLEDLERYAAGEKQSLVLQAARESMELHKIFRGGIALEMERLSLTNWD